MLHISWCVLMIQTPWSYPQRSITVQWIAIDKKKKTVASNLRLPFKGLLAKKRTLAITAVPRHHVSIKFGLFLCAHMDLEAFHFSQLICNGEVMALTWPKITDTKSWENKLEVLMPSSNPPRLKPLWQTLQAGHDWTLFKARSVNLTWSPDLKWPGVNNFTHCPKLMCNKLCQVVQRYAPQIFGYTQKLGTKWMETYIMYCSKVAWYTDKKRIDWLL